MTLEKHDFQQQNIEANILKWRWRKRFFKVKLLEAIFQRGNVTSVF